MKPIAWIVGGFALTSLAAVLQSMGDVGTGPSARLPLYLPALLILLGGQYCLWKGFRTGIVALWSGAFDRRRKTPAADAQQPAYRKSGAEPADTFDADAVFARYMERQQAFAPAPPQDAPPPAPPPTAAPPSARPGFGRRIV